MEILAFLTGTFHSGVTGNLCRYAQLDLGVIGKNQFSSMGCCKAAAKIGFPRNLLNIGIVTAHSSAPGADLHVFRMEPASHGMNLGRNGMEEGREGFGVPSVFGQRLYQRLVMVGSQASSRCGVDRDSVPVQ